MKRLTMKLKSQQNLTNILSILLKILTEKKSTTFVENNLSEVRIAV